MNKQLHSTKSSTRTLNTRLKTKQIPSNFTINKNIPKKIPSINTHSTRPLTTTLLPDKIPHSLSNTPQLPHINPKHSLTPLNSLRSFSSQIQPPVSIPQYNTFVPTRLFGHGVDVAYIPRFVDTIQNFGDRFYKKALHVNEIDQIRGIDDINQKAKFLASRWAMKEALVKATGKRLFFPELELKRHDKSTLDPRPFVVTSGNAKDFFLKMNFCDVHISISHDQDYAFASVVINQGPPYANLNSAEAESFVVGERKDVV